jgi:hypothetical protein
VFFFLKIIGNVRVAFCLAAGLLILAVLGISPRFGIVPGEMGWWDWTYFIIGVLLFLSLGALAILHFFESELVLCGEPGVTPAWAEFFGVIAPVVTRPSATPTSAANRVQPKAKTKTFPFTCRQCGATSDVPYLGAACGFCGETPTSAKKKGLSLDDVSTTD